MYVLYAIKMLLTYSSSMNYDFQNILSLIVLFMLCDVRAMGVFIESIHLILWIYDLMLSFLSLLPSAFPSIIIFSNISCLLTMEVIRQLPKKCSVCGWTASTPRRSAQGCSKAPPWSVPTWKQLPWQPTTTSAALPYCLLWMSKHPEQCSRITSPGKFSPNQVPFGARLSDRGAPLWCQADMSVWMGLAQVSI